MCLSGDFANRKVSDNIVNLITYSNQVITHMDQAGTSQWLFLLGITQSSILSAIRPLPSAPPN